MRRVYADSAGIRASTSGVNAQTATNPSSFIFDSRSRAYFGAYMIGAVPFASFSGIPLTYTVSYGKTFAVPPPVLIAVAGPNYSGVVSQYFEGASGGYSFVLATIGTTNLLLSIQNFSGLAPSTVYYLIGQS